MNVQSINAAAKVMSQTASSVQEESQSPFKSFFDAAMTNLDETSTLVNTADKMSLDLALGKTDNVADVMIAQEKASVALQYTVQLRSKLLDAYNEIMRIQI